jgi:hypothetical protein
MGYGIPTSFEEAEGMLTGRCANSRKVANHTYVQRRGADIAVKLHATDVATFRPDGTVELSTGGWVTVTTKERMNAVLRPGFVISQDRARWYVSRWDDSTGWHRVAAYADGMVVNLVTGKITGGEAIDTVSAEDAANAQMRKDVARFVRAITPEQIVTAFENPGGDCWGCRFGIGGTSCLADHVEEGYFHAHLALRALTDKGYRDPNVIMSMIYGAAKGGRVDRILTDALRRYLRRNLTVGAVAVR